MKLSNDIIWRKIDNEIFLINTKNNYLYELNETSSLIFEYLNNGLNKYEIIKKISELYEVDLDVLKSDVEEILANFIKEGIYRDEKEIHQTRN